VCSCKGEGITVDYHNSATWNKLKSKHVFFPSANSRHLWNIAIFKGQIDHKSSFFHSKLLRNQRVIAICRSDCHQAVLGSPSARCWTPGEGEREREILAHPQAWLCQPARGVAIPCRAQCFFLPWRLGHGLGKYWLYIYMWYIMIDNG
jgi:hypothetical protein